MDKEFYDKVSNNVPLGGVVDALMSQLREALNDANNQGENGSELGMAIAVGRANRIFNDLYSCWLSVKE